MTIKKTRKNPYKAGVLMDMIHVILCLGVVVTAVVIFFNPVQFALFFPLVFILAATMQFLRGVPKILVYTTRHRASDKKTCLSGIAFCILGFLLCAMAIASAITLW